MNVLQYIERFDAALVGRDYDSLNRLVSPTFTMVNPLAQRMTRPQWLAWLARDIRYLNIEREGLTSRVFGECAVVTSNVTAIMAVSGLYGGEPAPHHTFRTEVWGATEEGMQLQHVHLTRSDPDSADAEEQLRRCEQRRSDAMDHCDREVLDEVFADDFVLVHGDGSIDDKRGAIESAYRVRRRVVAPRELSIRVAGDVALLTGPMTLAVGVGAEERIVPVYLGQVACRTPRGWRFVWSQVTLKGPRG